MENWKWCIEDQFLNTFCDMFIFKVILMNEEHKIWGNV